MLQRRAGAAASAGGIAAAGRGEEAQASDGRLAGEGGESPLDRKCAGLKWGGNGIIDPSRDRITRLWTHFMSTTQPLYLTLYIHKVGTGTYLRKLLLIYFRQRGYLQ